MSKKNGKLNKNSPTKTGSGEGTESATTDELVDAAKKLLKAWDAQLPLGKPKVSVVFKSALSNVRRMIEEGESKSTSPSTESTPSGLSRDEEDRVRKALSLIARITKDETWTDCATVDRSHLRSLLNWIAPNFPALDSTKMFQITTESPQGIPGVREFEDLLEAATNAHEVIEHCVVSRCVPTKDEMLELGLALAKAERHLGGRAKPPRPITNLENITWMKKREPAIVAKIGQEEFDVLLNKPTDYQKVKKQLKDDVTRKSVKERLCDEINRGSKELQEYFHDCSALESSALVEENLQLKEDGQYMSRRIQVLEGNCKTLAAVAHNHANGNLDVFDQQRARVKELEDGNERLKEELLGYYRMAQSGVWVESDKYSSMVKRIADLEAKLAKSKPDITSRSEMKRIATIDPVRATEELDKLKKRIVELEAEIKSIKERK